MAGVLALFIRLVLGVDVSHPPNNVPKKKALIIGVEPEADHSVDAATPDENAEPEPSPCEPVESAKPQEPFFEESAQEIGELLASLERRH